MKAFEEYEKRIMPLPGIPESWNGRPTFEDAVMEWNIGHSCDRPNEPDSYRAAND